MEELKNKGNEAFKAQKYTEAISFYTKALEENPNPEAAGALYSNRAACYQSLSQFQKSLEDAESCIRCRPNWLKGHFRKGLALESLKRPDDAIKAFREALRLEPGTPDTLERLTFLNNFVRERNENMKPANCKTPEEAKQIGNSLFSDGKYDRAAQFYSRALELQKEPTKEKANYYANRAACLQQTHSYKEMITDCDAALAIDPQHIKALIRRAIAYEGLEKWSKALEDYNAVNRLSPGMSNISQGVLRCQRAARA